MKVFVVRWEEDGESLEAVVDRQSQALTGLETADFAAYAVVDESEPAQSIAYPVRWRVVNKRAEPVDVSLLARGQTGIELNRRVSFTLAAGEERFLEAAYVCTVAAPPLDPANGHEARPAPAIKTTLVIGGDVVELGTGLRYRPAVQVSAEPEFPSLLPGQSRTIYLQLRNRAARPVTGDVTITPQEGLQTDWLRHEFQLEKDGYAGLPLVVTCDEAGSTPLLVTATFSDGAHHSDGAHRVTTAAQRIPLLVTPPAGVSADRARDRVVVENDFFQLVCQARAGACQVWNKARQRRDVSIVEEVGPPFEPWDLSGKQYDLALEQGQGWARVTLTAESGDFCGLSIAREITVTASPQMRVCYRVVNNSATVHRFQVRPCLKFCDLDASHVALPRREWLVVERASEFPAVRGDLPQKPDLLAEQWIALTRDGQASGAIWDAGVAEHEFWWERLSLCFAERALDPQTAVQVGPFYLYVGPGDWRAVRRAWQRTTGRDVRRPKVVSESARPCAFGLSPVPLVLLNGRVETSLVARSVRQREMEGRIVVEPPPGWSVDRAEFPLESLSSKKPVEATLCLTATDHRIGADAGRLRLEGSRFDEVHPFTVIRLGDEKALVQVEKTEGAGQRLWTIANGRCIWTVAPAFHGGAIAWREAGSDVNHLMTSFPDDGELGWIKPWFGGIRPMITPMDEDQGWPGKLHEETFAAEPFETTDTRGISWRGVHLVASLEREGFEGLRAEIAYLTVGCSNVLKTVYRLVNETSVHRGFRIGLLAFCQVDGQYGDTVLYGDGFQRKRTPQTSFLRVGPWGVAVNPATGRAIVHVLASGEKRIELSDWGVEGGHPFAYNRVVLPPHGSHAMVTYLALCGSLEEAKRYGTLAQNDELEGAGE
jgi:hypothetical protein